MAQGNKRYNRQWILRKTQSRSRKCFIRITSTLFPYVFSLVLFLLKHKIRVVPSVDASIQSTIYISDTHRSQVQPFKLKVPLSFKWYENNRQSSFCDTFLHHFRIGFVWLRRKIYTSSTRSRRYDCIDVYQFSTITLHDNRVLTSEGEYGNVVKYKNKLIWSLDWNVDNPLSICTCKENSFCYLFTKVSLILQVLTCQVLPITLDFSLFLLPNQKSIQNQEYTNGTTKCTTTSTTTTSTSVLKISSKNAALTTYTIETKKQNVSLQFIVQYLFGRIDSFFWKHPIQNYCHRAYTAFVRSIVALRFGNVCRFYRKSFYCRSEKVWTNKKNGILSPFARQHNKHHHTLQIQRGGGIVTEQKQQQMNVSTIKELKDVTVVATAKRQLLNFHPSRNNKAAEYQLMQHLFLRMAQIIITTWGIYSLVGLLLELFFDNVQGKTISLGEQKSTSSSSCNRAFGHIWFSRLLTQHFYHSTIIPTIISYLNGSIQPIQDPFWTFPTALLLLVSSMLLSSTTSSAIPEQMYHSSSCLETVSSSQNFVYQRFIQMFRKRSTSIPALCLITLLFTRTITMIAHYVSSLIVFNNSNQVNNKMKKIITSDGNFTSSTAEKSVIADPYVTNDFDVVRLCYVIHYIPKQYADCMHDLCEAIIDELRLLPFIIDENDIVFPETPLIAHWIGHSSRGKSVLYNSPTRGTANTTSLGHFKKRDGLEVYVELHCRLNTSLSIVTSLGKDEPSSFDNRHYYVGKCYDVSGNLFQSEIGLRRQKPLFISSTVPILSLSHAKKTLIQPTTLQSIVPTEMQENIEMAIDRAIERINQTKQSNKQ